jgi:hypothetical protein
MSTIQNKFYRDNPQQLSLFVDEHESTIRLDLELQNFGVNSVHYKQLKEEVLKMQQIVVTTETVYYNNLAGMEMEANETMPLIAGLIVPKKYQRYISIRLDKKVVELLVNVGDKGYTKYWLEIAMAASSKYTLLIYQLISSWADKGGFTWTIKHFKEHLGIANKYENWKDLNARVIKPAYRELHEKANVWFEYNVEKKDNLPYKIIFKVVRGYYNVIEANTHNINEEPVQIMDVTTLNDREKECLEILRDNLLINDNNILGEIVSAKIDDFFKWWEVNENKLSKMSNPSSLLLYYLQMTPKQGWCPQRWILSNGEDRQKKHAEIWGRICINLEIYMDKPAVARWFHPLSIDSIDYSKKTVAVNAPNEDYVNWIEQPEHLKAFLNALEDEFKQRFIPEYLVLE